MAQSGYTPISLYYSSTSGHVPTAGNLTNGELAINTADGILFYKNAGGTVVPLSGSGGLNWQSVQSANFTATGGNAYPINTTSAAITVTLPASPVVGQSVGVLDYAGTFATNNLTINPNGNKLNGSTSNIVLSSNREALTLVYADATEGWVAYSSFNAASSATYSVNYLAVGGGGAGGAYGFGGGGGAGGVLSGSTILVAGQVYTITVGAGGLGTSNAGTPGGSGGYTAGLGVVAAGGGGGGSSNTNNAQNGGSGGGASGSSVGTFAGGTGIAGQGNNGGSNLSSANACGGGGGGAGAVGGTATSSVAGDGGVGISSSITGVATYYGGGGGGGCFSGTAGNGGLGGGGAGSSSGAGTSATANTGGGGGGGGGNATSQPGGDGGSGIFIISIPTANYSGTTTGSPTVTTVGGNTVLQFTASGSYTA